MMDIFTRAMPEATLSVDTVNDKPMLRGWAHRYGSLSHEMQAGRVKFRERFMPGAFRRAIESASFDLRALINHDKNQVLGRKSSGTLKVQESDQGVYFEIDPPDTGFARDLMESVRRGDVSGCSFRFSEPKQAVKIEDGQYIREIREAGIKEISIVTWPAYEDGSSVEVRSLNDQDLIRQFEELDNPKTSNAMLAAVRRQRLASLY